MKLDYDTFDVRSLTRSISVLSFYKAGEVVAQFDLCPDAAFALRSWIEPAAKRALNVTLP